uniref:Peroxidase n=1 Tax=Pinus tabuliformis TaxID=88731 RepID=A0A0K0M7B2_PINTB|nr:MCE1 [Pinus tabuliformis]
MERISKMAVVLRTSFVFMLISVGASTKTCLSGSLKPDYYAWTCPEADAIIFAGVEKAVIQEARMAASLLRLHFHDCFVNGCDASVLLDDTVTFVGEKTAVPNLNSLRGFEVIDAIKQELEFACPGTVSCADILAMAARDSVVLTGGASWEVQLGRRDSLTASKTAANNNIPAPTSNVATLNSKFQNVGLTEQDMVTLSGAHTIGKARCATFNSRLTGQPDPTLQKEFLTSLQQICFQGLASNNNTVTSLDVETPVIFDNQYYQNLPSGEGLLNSDQVLYSTGGTTRELVEFYMQNQEAFFENFKTSMIKMGNIQPLTGTNGEIRRNCRFVNSLG